MLGMRRREFITLLGGAAAWPIAARAQQSDPMRRIAWLMSFAESDPLAPPRVAAFEGALQQFGWTAGTTFGSSIAGPQATPISCGASPRSWQGLIMTLS
jgi:hypothetical protein